MEKDNKFVSGSEQVSILYYIAELVGTIAIVTGCLLILGVQF